MKHNKTLSITRNIIPYIKELRTYTKSVTSSILMQQLEYWFEKQNYQPFYKFREPCEHKAYKIGDSWTEELGMSKDEFLTAFNNIGISYKSKTEFLEKLKEGNPFCIENENKELSEKFYCYYFDRQELLTYYYRNHALVNKSLEEMSTLLESDNPALQKATNAVLLESDNPALLYNRDYLTKITTNNPTTTQPQFENQILKAFGLATIEACEKFRDCKAVIDSLLQFQSNAIGKLRQETQMTDVELKEQAIEDINKGYFQPKAILRAKEIQDYFQEELKSLDFIDKLSNGFYELQLKNFQQKSEFMFIGNISNTPSILKATINKATQPDKTQNKEDFNNKLLQDIQNLIGEIQTQLKQAPKDYYENPYSPASIEYMEHNEKIHTKYNIKNYAFVLDYVLENKPPLIEAGSVRKEFIQNYKDKFIYKHGNLPVYSLWKRYESLIENDAKFFPEVEKVFD